MTGKGEPLYSLGCKKRSTDKAIVTFYRILSVVVTRGT